MFGFYVMAATRVRAVRARLSANARWRDGRCSISVVQPE